jgi:hypothetical protein
MVSQAPQILDTWTHFVATAGDCVESADGFLDSWYGRYMSRWPSLRALFLRDYEEQGESWRELGAKFIYPPVRHRMPAMARAHASLLEIIPEIDGRYRALLGGRSAMRYVICVDMGFAGWAGRYGGRRAVFLGLAQIARLGWHRAAALRDLLCHELGHHAHGTWRRRARLPDSVRGAVGRLYGEGFAQRLGHVLGDGRWHQASGDWLRRCRQQMPQLAARFLAAAQSSGDVRPFFGDWLSVDGLSMTGYFMGHEMIRSLERSGMSLAQIARLEASQVETTAIAFLQSFAHQRNTAG